MQRSLKLAALAFALCLGAPVLAQQASEGNWMVRARAVSLDFDNGQRSGLPIGGTTKVEANDRWIPEVDISYFFTPNIAAELVLTYPQRINIDVGGHKEGTIKALPPSLLLQYHFTQLGAFKPYVGAGVNYTRFSKRKNILGGAASVEKDSFGPAVQAGFDYALSKNWSVNFDVKYIRMDTDVKVGGVKRGKIDLDPMLYGIGIGYRF
ncbi:MAG: outer membrane beta-barrel protein [Candidatus Accumulibacter sp.]|jgi:outer membrane protein|nr:outer membrane beta-barrel protein [Accumulibacter sp.]